MYNKKKTVIVIMMIVLMLMATGYAWFATSLNISTQGNISSLWSVYFSSITEGAPIGNATNAITPNVSGTSATISVNLASPGDSMTYKLVLTNGGNVDAIVEKINAVATGSSAIVYSITGISNGEKLGEGESIEITLKVEYDATITSQPEETSKTLTISIVSVQDVGQDIEGGNGGSTTAVVFNKETPNDLTFTSEADLSTFQEVKVDNVTVDESNYTLTSGSTVVTFKKEYLNTLNAGAHTVDIVSTGGTHSSTFEVVTSKPNTSLVENILNNNEVYADNVASKYVTNSTGINFGEISSDTNGKGLYYTSTNTENNATTYYFRGNVDNNYVAFGGKERAGDKACLFNGEVINYYYNTSTSSIVQGVVSESNCNYVCNVEGYGYVANIYPSGCYYMTGANDSGNAVWDGIEIIDMLWRIVRINEDGSVRLIKQNNLGNVDNNSSKGWHNLVGYMYGSSSDSYESTHVNTNDSPIKTYLEDWYEATLKTNYGSYVTDAGFCNDRSVAPQAGLWNTNDTALGYGNNETYYGAYNRLINLKQPQFACPQTNDLYTTKTSNKGNKALKYPIGMLSADEAMYSGLAPNVASGDAYLVTAEFSTMSPYFQSDFAVYADEWEVTSDGRLYANEGDGPGMSTEIARPVINIRGNLEITLEETGVPGSATNPYVIK